MLICQRTNTEGLIYSILGNAELGSLGKVPGDKITARIADAVDAREWFLSDDNHEPGEKLDNGMVAGFEANFCIDWVTRNKEAYMAELFSEWKKSDDQLIEMVCQVEKKFYSAKPRRGRVGAPSKPHASTMKTCKKLIDIIKKCREEYYG